MHRDIYRVFYISISLAYIIQEKRKWPAATLYNDYPDYLFPVYGIDGAGSYLGLYETNNIIRFITGLLSGASIMVILYPIFVFQYYQNSKKEKIFKNPYKFIIFIIILAVFAALTLFRINFLGSFYYYLSIFSVLFTFYAINLVMVFLVPFFSQKANKLLSKHLILPSVISVVLLIIEIFVAYKFHQVLNTLLV